MADGLDGLGGIPDLGALGRERSGAQDEAAPVYVPGKAYYANDATASIDPGGCVTVEFFFRSNQAVHDPVTVAMPVAVYMQLAALAPQVREAVTQALEQAQSKRAERGMDAARQARDGQ